MQATPDVSPWPKRLLIAGITMSVIGLIVFISFGENFFEHQDPRKSAQHKVKFGENLTLIARKYNVRIYDIMKVNKGLKHKKYIHPGQKLTIPITGSNLAEDKKDKKIIYTIKLKRMKH